jgi:hypothetical protein
MIIVSSPFSCYDKCSAIIVSQKTGFYGGKIMAEDLARSIEERILLLQNWLRDRENSKKITYDLAKPNEKTARSRVERPGVNAGVKFK